MTSAERAAEPFISVVVTTKNAARHLPDLLADFGALDWPRDRLEFVLVDAHSTDGTWEGILEFAKRPPAPVVARQWPGFIGAGRNEGFRLARADFVAVTDADMRVPATWLRELWTGMGDGVGVVGGPNEAYGTDATSRAIAAIPTHGPSVGAVPVGGVNRWKEDYETSTDVYGAVTRNSLFRKAAFDAAGGFDESLRVTEDPELNFRILRAGYRIRYRRAAGVRHVHRDTLRSFTRQQGSYAYWQAHVNRKHPGLASLKHWAPAAAGLLFVLVLALAFVETRFALVALALVAVAVLAALGYGGRAALVRGEPDLVLVVPLYFLAWQLAWAVAYPAGVLHARKWAQGHRTL